MIEQIIMHEKNKIKLNRSIYEIILIRKRFILIFTGQCKNKINNKEEHRESSFIAHSDRYSINSMLSILKANMNI